MNTFWQRYEKLCLENGYQPGSEQAAKILGTNRATISTWRTKGKLPNSNCLIVIANTYGVSTDYLLCRTCDPTDYANPDIVALSNIDDAKKNLALQNIAAAQRIATPEGNVLFDELDDMDQVRAEAYMQGLLSQDKYASRRKKRA